MSRQKNIITEFRNYHLPIDFPILILTGDQWHISDIPSQNLHFHNCLELGICHEGSGILQVQNRKIPFTEGDITCISRNIPHTTYSSPGTSSRWSYIFTDPTELLHTFTVNCSKQFSEIMEKLNHVCIVNKANVPDAAGNFNEILNAITNSTPCFQLKVKADLLSLLIDISNNSSINDSFSAFEVSASLSILPALEYIKSNYMDNFKMNDLAELCGLSPTHFRRIFSTAMGTNPLDYLNSVRINNACYLLKSTEDSILSISESVGFHSISSFNRFFDRLVGMPPREYRNTNVHDDRFQRAKIMKCNGWFEPEY